jgi:hypothetical protein
MNQQTRFLLIGVVALALVAAVALTGGNPAGPEHTLALEMPAFVLERGNAAAPPEVAAMLTNEAGISAYMQTVGPITLNTIRGQYRTIEAETADYIIGSVAIPNHPEHFDVHVYVHRNGWIVAYYMSNEATGKMINVLARTISTTKLETAISIIAGAAGEAVSGLKYYDFRYPNATHILIVAEDHVDGRDFNITMPTEFGYFERSFGVYNNTDGYNREATWHLYINGTAAPRSWRGWYMAYGSIPASQLLPGQSHYVNLHSSGTVAYGALVITYRVP